MILVDSSVWIDHLRAGEPTLVELLNTGRALWRILMSSVNWPVAI